MKEYEVVGRQGDSTNYRLKGGRAVINIHDKAWAEPKDIVTQLEAAERRLDQDFRANADTHERLPTGRRPTAFLDIDPVTGQPTIFPCATDGTGATFTGTLYTTESVDGLVIGRGPVSISVHDRELSALVIAIHRRQVAGTRSRRDRVLDRLCLLGLLRQDAEDELRKIEQADAVPGGLA